MNTALIILCALLTGKWVMEVYINRRVKRIRHIKRTIYRNLPKHDNYKFMAALQVYLAIEWDKFIWRGFFKPITLGRLIPDEQLKILLGTYVAPTLTPERLRDFMVEIKFALYNEVIIISELEAAKPNNDSYEF